MQDLASPVADRISRSVSRATDNVERWKRAVNSAQSSVGGLGQRLGTLSSNTIAKLSDKARQLNGNLKQGVKHVADLESQLGKSGGVMSSLKSKAALLATALGGFGLISFVNEASAAYREVQNIDRVIQFAGGKDGAKNLQFVNDIAKQLKLPLLATKEGFKQFSGATMGTALEGEKTRDVFKSVSIASAAMGLSADNTQGVFLALSQMMSKGKVSAEELRGQLGERMPGAFNIAAKAMGKTQQELDKMMENGQLMAADFLPAFARELERTYASALPGYFKSAQAYTNQYNNQLQEFKTKSGEALIPIQFRFMELGSTIMDRLLPIIIQAADFINKNWGLIKDSVYALTLGVLVGAGAFLAHKAYAIGSMIATQGFTVAMSALNLAFLANPVTWIVIGIIAFVAAIVLAYQRVDWFRGGILGLWEAAKTVFSNIGDFFKRIFEPIFKAIEAFKNGDYTAAAKFTAKGLFNLTPVGLAVEAGKYASEGGFTKGVGASFNKGYKQGVDEIAAKKVGEKQKASIFSSFADDPFGDTGTGSGAEPPKPSFGGAGGGTTSSGSTGVSGKPKSITISISNLVRVDNFYGNSENGKKQVTDVVVEALIRAVNGASIVLEGNE